MRVRDDGWVIFDGDNTLWNVESLYDGARTQLCAYLHRFGVDPLDADAYQRGRDQELFRELGYSPTRFPRSFTDTLLHFNPNAPCEAQKEVLRIGQTVFTSAAPPVPSVDEILSALARSHRLALLTAGDQEVQKRRLEAFQRTHYFEHVQIVEVKNADALGELLSQIRAAPLSTWAVGDSLRSDILPAVHHGLNAIHIDAQNWRPVEIGELSLPPGVHRVSSLEEAALIIRNSV